MNKTALKNFAVAARRELIERVELQALKNGITKENVAEETLESSDAVIINGQPLTSVERRQRNHLINRINDKGFDQVVDEVAYTWFNRFVALRFMEVNDYIPTRVRVLSSENPSSTEPDMLKEALSLDLDIDKEKVYYFKTNNKTDELFKYLIQLHCNDLNRYMPFMFETLEDYTMILFPEGLLGTESFVRDMTNTEMIPEENWEQVEIVGWLYQYYISEENERVIQAKKQYKPGELPAATQLFTPEWIVKYMVQNALGRYWVESHPEQKDLIDNWEFYLKNRQEDYAEKIKKYVNNDLNIEEITCFDPAMGSGHILVYMFDVLYEIYEKNGYMAREIPRLIIEKNLYGLDIDQRAYQLASFSVVMKALQYNRRFLRSIEREGLQINLTVIDETNDINEDELVFLAGENEGEAYGRMKSFIDQFKDAKAIGSLIKLNEYDSVFLEKALESLILDSNDMFSLQLKDRLSSLFKNLYKQSQIMNMKHDVLITNPPYAGSRYIPSNVKKHLNDHYADVKRDLFSSFIEYSFSATKENGQIGFMTPYVWMFISSYEKLREKIINDRSISSLIQLEYSGFDGATVPICTFTLRNYKSDIEGEYIRLEDFTGAKNQPIKTLEAVQSPDVSYRYTFEQEKFNKIPGSPIAYWASANLIHDFEIGRRMDEIVNPKQGLATAHNNRFLRFWWEVAIDTIKFDATSIEDSVDSGRRWFPYNKGGSFRRWYGNYDYVVNWENDGHEIRNFVDGKGKLRSRPQNTDFYFKEAITWSDITSGSFSLRYREFGSIHDVKGMSAFGKDSNELFYLLGLMNTTVANYIFKMLNPTISLQIGNFQSFPVLLGDIDMQQVVDKAKLAVDISKDDWNSQEITWGFSGNPYIEFNSKSLMEIQNEYDNSLINNRNKLLDIENSLNTQFIDIYGLGDVLSNDIQKEDLTLLNIDHLRDVRQFISYTIGCALGRYSLDEKGLIYAGGIFDAGRYKTFPADEDNILLISSDPYAKDDIVSLFINFVETTYGSEKLEENLLFVAEAIGKRKSENAREAIRRYFLNNFYKDHVQTYKKHPIYWLFTSGKEKAFNCLIYMHRYDKTTLSRMRTDYLHHAQARYETEKSDLQQVIESEASTTEIRHAKKELTSVEKKIAELKTYDEKLHHMADMQIEIDLDDGVKVNYKKFEGLVAKI